MITSTNIKSTLYGFLTPILTSFQYPVKLIFDTTLEKIVPYADSLNKAYLIFFISYTDVTEQQAAFSKTRLFGHKGLLSIKIVLSATEPNAEDICQTVGNTIKLHLRSNKIDCISCYNTTLKDIGFIDNCFTKLIISNIEYNENEDL